MRRAFLITPTWPGDRVRFALLAAATAGLAAFGATGCGSGKSYANNPRPPAPIVVAAAITPKSITVSPATFGAGLIQLVVTNLTTGSQQLEIVSATQGGSGAPRFRQQTGPINPQDTATLNADLRQGSYTVRAIGRGSGTAVKSAKIAVGAPRATSQNVLLQP